ncbi:O-antigen ligase family protein [Allopontixanthobacter sp.]|uniref:O-antigen ligase family protein n=1 Tax=Allopontixanthobacter sp. TaxID=2906452 RepID=UPI002ABA0BB7|nr:O-antigen ligase family protein [Allopontixanthobacter sp.]MDZ4307596.1 O-antigen ligase family protein [Allopontixanthobacter sp.]
MVPQQEILTEPRPTILERALAATLLAVLLLINVALIDFSIADFPVRGMAAIALLGAAILIYPARVLAVVRQHSLLLWLTAGFAFLGAFVSFANGTEFSLVWQGLMEVPLQVAVTVIIASVLVQIAGVGAGIWVIAAVIGGSALVAVLQFMGLDAAWQLREWLGNLQGLSRSEPVINRRPMGISFSPIQLSTQLCVAFAVFAAARDRLGSTAESKAPADPLILFALAVLVVGSLVTLTRSPILGAAIFLVFYTLLRPGTWLVFGGLLAVVAIYLIGPYILDLVQQSAPRVIRTDDGSVMARASMNTFGLMLFADNPLGYGYAFRPGDHWTRFWQELQYTPSPDAAADKELHNYLLNMLNTYGIGLLLILPLVVVLLKRAQPVLIFFIPYIVHILFHNSGPFWTDIPFWFGVAVLSALPRHVQPDDEYVEYAMDEDGRNRASRARTAAG